MEFDDDELDDPRIGPLLPADDRLWRHPSEMAAAAPPRPGRRQAGLLAVAALASSISVLLTLGVVAVVRPVRTQLAVERVALPKGHQAAIEVSGVAELADRLQPSIASVVAVGAGGLVRRGSGVVYRSDGLLLTTQHVVAGAVRIDVMFDDGRIVAARLVGSDEETDIAVLDADGDGFETAALGSATTLRAGHPAITVGTPAEGAATPVVTVGVVSAVGRTVMAGDRRLLDMIQIDAAVAPGCAGGAVVDRAGVVVGIATVNVDQEGGTSGYATPIDVARLVAEQLLTDGRTTRPWIGVEGADLGSGRASELAVDGGAVVKAIRPGSPAARAGIQAGDVLLAVDGEELTSMTALIVELRSRRPGDVVRITIARGDERRTVDVTLGATS
ncbi:MAG TPA: trypsin-like peptidase domain-containing protein [Acidimicrobiales bacterium]|nr:trypsin-like peptidase domain-containing protein [Acidimicrobiales bacterium]